METLELKMDMITFLREDIINMSKLKKFSLKSSHIVKLKNKFCEFPNINYLRLGDSDMLKELPHLHNLRSLKKLDIIS